MTTAIEQTLETYGIENWAAGYFDVNRKGNLIVRPVEGDPRSADLKEIIDDLAKRGITTPVLLRKKCVNDGAPPARAMEKPKCWTYHPAMATGSWT